MIVHPRMYIELSTISPFGFHDVVADRPKVFVFTSVFCCCFCCCLAIHRSLLSVVLALSSKSVGSLSRGYTIRLVQRKWHYPLPPRFAANPLAGGLISIGNEAEMHKSSERASVTGTANWNVTIFVLFLRHSFVVAVVFGQRTWFFGQHRRIMSTFRLAWNGIVQENI